nr:13589_t:CDS:2 [Entrophospora candida]
MSSINDCIVTTSLTTTPSSTTSLDLASSSLPPYPSKYVMSVIVPITTIKQDADEGERKEGEEGDQATGDNNSIVIDINNNNYYNNDSDVMSEIMSEINGEKYYNGIKLPLVINGFDLSSASKIFRLLSSEIYITDSPNTTNNIPIL